ncbi:hypothetical protein JCGZ_03135 [Jatropha curcas]|uniref:Uncharacterized protein n=1 Tax=Jatropha curcas TaxID=180498 RepID=A0A067JPP3_JATCU|nr:hypothetical protein JCGZ_03135 [Jatropha curcas]
MKVVCVDVVAQDECPWTRRDYPSFFFSIYPSSRASRQIIRIIKLQLHKEGYTWDAVSQEVRDFYWEEFQEKLSADRYADFTCRMRRSGKKQQCVCQEIWESWQQAWEDPAFKRKREIFAQNRRSETGSDGVGPSRHTSGSISTIETARLLQRQIAELREHVMRLSGQLGAGTSSSDPTPTTDRNVSRSQQQPLPSPDPDAANDTLVTPPGTTAHPAGTPPADSTLDRADELLRRFDFGPF